MLPSGKFSRTAPAVAGLLIVILIIVIEGIRPSPANLLLSNFLQAALVFWAAYCSFRVARHSRGYLHQLWMLLAAALILGGAAKAIATYYQSFAHAPSAAPWPADVLFILWVTPTIMMFVSPSAEETSEIDWRQILDFAQVGVLALTAYLYFLYVPSHGEASGPQMIRRMLLAQLIRDAALGAGFLMGAARAFPQSIRAFFRRMFYLFLAASAADLIYLLGPRTFPSTPNWTDITWCAPYFFAAVSAATWKSGEEPIAQETRSPFRVMIIPQILPVCIPLLVLFMGKRIAAEQMTIAWAAITASLMVSTARLLLTNEKQRRLAHDFFQIEQARRRSEHMFSTAFRLSPDAMGIHAIPGTQFLEVNDSFTRLTGYTREETIGRTPLEMNLWADPYHLEKIMAKLREESEVREEEFYSPTKSGEMGIFQFSGTLIEQGGQLCALVIVRDITERKKTEKALRASEERFRSLIQEMHVGILLLGPDTEAKFANQAALDMFGLRRDQALGNSISQTYFIPILEDGTEIPRVMLPGVRAAETRLTIRNQVVGWRRPESNDVLWTLIDAIPQLTDQGEVAGVILSITNITELKKAEEALRSSEELFRTLVENLHVGVGLIGPHQEIQFANRASFKMFGMRKEQVLGKKMIDLGMTALNEDGTEMPVSMRPVPRAIASKQTVANAVMGWRRAGSNDVLWIQGEAIPLFGENGELERVIASFSDITKRKQAEEALHQLSTRLLQLQDEERRRLGRELHDVLAQSVMAVNLDLAQVARSSVPLDEKAKRALSEARSVLGEMSREIRTLSYMLHPPVLDELGLASAIQEYATGFSERSGIALEVDLQAGFGRLAQEAETALFRIVQESLSNIQRHSGSRAARIRLRGGSDYVELQVSDQGRGMDQMAVERGSSAGTRLGVGILGMRERMAQLGGRLEVESSSSGTTVRATIPLRIEVYDVASHPRGG